MKGEHMGFWPGQNNNQGNPGQPYQPRDAVAVKDDLVVDGFIVGSMLHFASGRICVTVDALGLWAEVRQGADGLWYVVKERQTKQGKTFTNVVGRFRTDGEMTIEIPALGNIKYAVKARQPKPAAPVGPSPTMPVAGMQSAAPAPPAQAVPSPTAPPIVLDDSEIPY